MRKGGTVSIAAIVGLVAGGTGAALVPESLRDLTRTGVVYKPVSGLPPTVELGAVWRCDDRKPVVHSFVSVINDVCQPERGAAAAGQIVRP